jgi:UDP-xylose/UDP-N-acetylglucosamine transporter B4
LKRDTNGAFLYRYFQNPFTATHWFGTFLVFAGTLLFSDVHGMVWQKIVDSKKKKE